MLRGRELIGRAVVDLKTGDEIGLVEDLQLDLDQGKVLALTVRSGGWLPHTQQIEMDQIQQVGEDAVLIAQPELLEPEYTSRTDSKGVLGIKEIKGLSVLSNQGKELGSVVDLVWGFPEGKITGWEISDGLVQDLVDGRRVLPLNSVLAYGSERFIVQEGGW